MTVTRIDGRPIFEWRKESKDVVHIHIEGRFDRKSFDQLLEEIRKVDPDLSGMELLILE